MLFNHLEQPKKIVVMTGATSGFGTHTLRLLVDDPDTTVLVGARGKDRSVPAGAEILPLDLESLASVRAFAQEVKKRIRERRIDICLLNAGVHGSSADQFSEDGYGRTFAVNHLAHYLLARLLLPLMADRGRLVITSSNMHNPPFKSMAPKGLEIQEWAHPTPDGSGVGTKGYCASKLCNLMTALTLSRRPEVKSRNIDIIAFNPGLTGGAGGNDAGVLQKVAVRSLMYTIFPLIGLFRPEFNMNTAEHSGRMLARVALGSISLPENSVYVSLVKGVPTFPAPSELAQDVAAQERLWSESAEMVGLARSSTVAKENLEDTR
ncbi:short chain dehydrogenase [Roseovarius sp. THAF27]|nr:short chain dehydrogenase [Roseovarius sp. THAF27]